MDWLTRIIGQNWAWHSHRRLYDMVRTDATGAGAVGGADEFWVQFTGMMDESVLDIQQALAEAGASWEGLAGESMYSSVAPLAQWAEDAGTAGGASGDSVRQVGEAFSYTANAMPEPVEVTSSANSTPSGWFTHLFGGQTDQDRQERESQQAKQRAVELMEGYSRNVDSAVTSVGSFVPPQSVAVRVPPQDFGGGPIHHETASFPGPSGGPGGSEGPPPLPKPNPPQQGPQPGPTPGGVPPGPTEGGHPTTPESAGPSEQPPVTKPPADPSDRGPVSRPPLNGFDPVTGFPIDSRTGRPVGPVTARPPETSGRPGGRGPGGDGEPGRGNRGGVDEGHRGAGRGGLGVGPLEGERAVGSRGAAVGPRGAAGGAGAGMAPMGAGVRREEDEEHYSPDFLREYHDEFWDGSPPLAPAVIGEEDKPPTTEGA